jgi:hypothetical protein
MPTFAFGARILPAFGFCLRTLLVLAVASPVVFTAPSLQPALPSAFLAGFGFLPLRPGTL